MSEANDTHGARGWVRLLITAGVIGALITAIGGIAVAWINTHPAQPKTTPISAGATTSTQSQADVIVCLTDVRYVPDPNPAPDRGVVEPVYLQTTLNLRNRGSAQAAVTFIYLDYLGIYLSNGQTIHTNSDYAPQSPIIIAGNGEVPHQKIYLLVDQRAEVKFASAQTRVDWEGGTGHTLNYTFDGVSWQNDPACSS